MAWSFLKKKKYMAWSEYLLHKCLEMQITEFQCHGCRLQSFSAMAACTIIGLIQRFYDVISGGIIIDGMDVREMNIIWFRGFTALVSQEPAMFSGSVRDNIAFGKPEADEDEIVEAARAANAYEFISSLSDGYDTDCGEHGIRLSGGRSKELQSQGQ